MRRLLSGSLFLSARTAVSFCLCSRSCRVRMRCTGGNSRRHKGNAQEVPRGALCKPPCNQLRVRLFRRRVVDRIFANKHGVSERATRRTLLHKLFVAFLALDNFKRLRELPAAFVVLHVCRSFQSVYGLSSVQPKQSVLFHSVVK